MSTRLMQGFFATALMAVQLIAAAEDIDLFVQPPQPDAGTRPDVLIILDNTGNWNDAFSNEMAALVNTFNNLPEDKFNVGMMFFGDPDVGYVRAAIRPMNAANRALYAAMINNLDVVEDRGNARTLARTFSEAHQYLKGLQTRSDKQITSPHNVKRDYTGNTTGNVHDVAVHALQGNALDSSTDTTYSSPIDPNNCFGTYIIYIGNVTAGGNVTSDNNRNTLAGQELANAGGDVTPIPMTYSSVHDGNYADEWTRFLKQSMGVITYTVDVDPTPYPPATGGKPNGIGNSNLLANMADVGGGKYFRVASGTNGGAEIADALNEIFSEIQAVNSVFASVSLPLSVNTQETFLNQVYVGVFRPDEDGKPRWNGNLKQYKLGLRNNRTELVTLDANDTVAINPVTGFIRECGRSFWTPATQDDYWDFLPQGGCTVGDADVNDASNSPDGNIVEKGAHAMMLREQAGDRSMRMRTCTDSVCTGGLVNFNTTNVSYSKLGLPDSTDHAALINWQLGLDVDDERPNLDFAEKRPSIHGDVVHSRPVAINYGSVDVPKVVVFYSGNDGVLRAINGNQPDDPYDTDDDIAGVTAGAELWSFVPPEFFGEIKRLRANDPQYKFFGNEDVTALPKPYGLDGAITARTDGDDTWIYVTARRGGRVVYAFDVSAIDTTPSSPTLLWKKGCPNQSNDTGCSSGFEQIGQTWSAVKPFKTGFSTSLAIMGGGYDRCEDEYLNPDPDPDTCTASSKGNRIYVLNSATGALLNTFDTDRGVAADVVVVTDKTTGRAKYAYAVDLDGNVYRISGDDAGSPFGSIDPAAWKITKLADLGCATAGASCNNRKFLFAPDVVEPNDGSGTYFLLLGSGDREKPLKEFGSAYLVKNYFFMLRDVPSDPDWLSGEDINCIEDVICLSSLLEIKLDSGTPDKDDLLDTKGWYLELHDHEQVVTSAISVFGTTTFSTHTPYDPPSGACTSTLGTARVYNVGFTNAGSRNGTSNRYEEVAGGGLPPSPVAGLVLIDGVEVPFIIGADPDSPLQGRLPTGSESGTLPKSLTYWFIEK